MTLSDSAALDGARTILDAHVGALARLDTLVRDARVHFEQADWHAVQRDSAARLDLHNVAVLEGLARLRERLGDALGERATWAALRGAYARLIQARPDAELAATFFNSFTRRLFHTIGVDPSMEFVSAPQDRTAPDTAAPAWSHTITFDTRSGLEPALRAVLEAFPFAPGYEDAAADAALAAAAITARHAEGDFTALEFTRSVFYRGKGAYLVGVIHRASGDTPLLLALTNPSGRIAVDAVLTEIDDVSVVFSFARSYFFVAMERPREMIAFLKALMPRKPVSDLYNALGFNKHGKTELYRSLLHHLATTPERFERAPGQRGMVMAVFTLPGFDVVFKVIRDRFEYPKTVTHDEVRARYRLVFRHDRAGRLVDAQEFEHLAFERHRFDHLLLEELLSSCAERVQVRGGLVVFSHLYTERRLRPLDLFLREATAEAAREAVVDYGAALRDLAATNVFPGDMLLKNFGVSRHGRLIFYDYDELCTLEECRFRELPASRDDHDEGAAEPSFYVGEHDIFPQEFRAFLGLSEDLLQTFLSHHHELLGAPFWLAMQERIRAGEVLDIYPYRSTRRLKPTPRRARSAGATSNP